jgi:hypothetical protein
MHKEDWQLLAIGLGYIIGITLVSLSFLIIK